MKARWAHAPILVERAPLGSGYAAAVARCEPRCVCHPCHRWLPHCRLSRVYYHPVLGKPKEGPWKRHLCEPEFGKLTLGGSGGDRAKVSFRVCRPLEADRRLTELRTHSCIEYDAAAWKQSGGACAV